MGLAHVGLPSGSRGAHVEVADGCAFRHARCEREGTVERIGIHVLGPPVLVAGGRESPVSGQRRRLLLCLLAAERGAPLSAEVLVDAMWGDEPPRRRRHALEGQIYRLRTTLGEADGVREAVVGDARGYRLDLERVDLDLVGLDRLAARGRQGLAAGDAVAALDELEAAVRLCRGPPFGEHAEHPVLLARARELEEIILAVQEDRVEAYLLLERGAELLPHLERLLQAHPLRERLWVLLLRALDQAGRRADALAAYARAADVLRDELGTDPGPELARLHHGLLTGTPTETTTSTATGAHHPTGTGDGQGSIGPPVGFALTSFVGRDDEMAAVADAIGTHRLVTLLGPGGVGKSRLAGEVARYVADGFPGGVRFVDVTDSSDPEAVALRLARAWEVVDRSDRPVFEVLTEHLTGRHALAVVDNCESPQAATALTALLARCPRLHVLATSRTALAVRGEVTWPLTPLETPATDDPVSVASSPAGRLFLDRARAADPHLKEDGTTMAAVGQVCRRLDGLPLALELAAAQLRTLSLAQLASRLEEQQFAQMQDPAQPERHRSLQVALLSSVDQLDPAGTTVLRRLSVVNSHTDLDAVEHLCTVGDQRIDDVLPALDDLVARSLVMTVTRGGEKRYWQLDVVRQHAHRLLVEAGEAEAVERAHTAWYLGFAERAARLLRGDQQLECLEQLRIEQDELETALARAWHRGDEATAFRLATALWRFWFLDSNLQLARRWLDVLVEHHDRASPAQAVHLLLGAAQLAAQQGDPDPARRDLQPAMEVARAAGLATLAAWVEVYRGIKWLAANGNERDYEEAEQAGRRALEVFEREGRTIGAAWAAYVATGARFLRLRTLGGLDEAECRAAAATLSPFLDAVVTVGERNSIGHLRELVGLVTLPTGDLDEAAHQLLAAARTLLELGNTNCCAHALDAVAELLVTSGDLEGAASLLAGTRAIRSPFGTQERHPHDLLARWQEQRDSCVEGLPPTDLERLEAEGRSRDVTGLVRLADERLTRLLTGRVAGARTG